MNNIFDVFTDSIDYGSTAIMEYGGLPEDTIINYISGTFLNGFINYVKPIKAYVVQRYRDDWENEVLPEYEKVQAEHHTRLENIPDDKWILGETDKDYWLFIYDMDVSDCSIGRVSKEDLTREEIIRLFEVSTLTNDTNPNVQRAQLDLTGWISG